MNVDDDDNSSEYQVMADKNKKEKLGIDWRQIPRTWTKYGRESQKFIRISIIIIM